MRKTESGPHTIHVYPRSSCYAGVRRRGLRPVVRDIYFYHAYAVSRLREFAYLKYIMRAPGVYAVSEINTHFKRGYRIYAGSNILADRVTNSPVDSLIIKH